jgi:hypothetical protein
MTLTDPGSTGLTGQMQPIHSWLVYDHVAKTAHIVCVDHVNGPNPDNRPDTPEYNAAPPRGCWPVRQADLDLPCEIK